MNTVGAVEPHVLAVGVVEGADAEPGAAGFAEMAPECDGACSTVSQSRAWSQWWTGHRPGSAASSFFESGLADVFAFGLGHRGRRVTLCCVSRNGKPARAWIGMWMATLRRSCKVAQSQ